MVKRVHHSSQPVDNGTETFYYLFVCSIHFMRFNLHIQYTPLLKSIIVFIHTKMMFLTLSLFDSSICILMHRITHRSGKTLTYTTVWRIIFNIVYDFNHYYTDFYSGWWWINAYEGIWLLRMWSIPGGSY